MTNDYDPNNPIDRMMPSGDNPEYHRKKAEYEKAKTDAAAQAVIGQHPHLADRMQPHVRGIRQSPPKASSPNTSAKTGQEYFMPDKTLQQEELHRTVENNPPKIDSFNSNNSHASSESNVKVHPLLQKLRQDFGIERIPLESIIINDTEFTLKVLDAHSITAALRFADTLSIGERENNLNLQIALTSFSVVSINNVPLWQVFDVPLKDEEKVLVEGIYRPVFDPRKPPERVKMTASTRFMDFLNKEATTDLLEKLWNFYKNKVSNKDSVEEILEDFQDTGDSSSDIPLL